MDKTLPVLIVDDNKQLRSLLRLQLKRFGCVCDEAENGQEALERIKEKYYPLIMLDIGMPVMDGFTCAAKIREFQQTEGEKRSVIVAVTGQSSQTECSDRGFDGFLQKPVLLDQMSDAIAQYYPSTVEGKRTIRPI